MKTLIVRELESMVHSWREAFRTYSLLGIGGIIAMWILGPHLLKMVSTESSYLLIAVMGLVLAFGRLTVSIERDQSNRQLTFLQTLPIRRTHIVHAKFASSLLLSIFTVIWITILFCLNMVVNGGKAEYGVIGAIFTSMYVFVIAVSLLWYYVRGGSRLNTLFYILLGLWVGIFFSLGLLLKLNTDFTIVQVMGLGLVVTVLIYFICWVLAVWRVHRKGIPQEESQAEDPVEFDRV